MADKHDELLDHEVDGIREFDNALPRWWLYGFYFTIVFAGVYLFNYHVLASPFFGESSLRDEYDVEMAAAATAGGAASRAGGVVVARTDAASLARGEAIFQGASNVCFSCHRPDLGGLIGPNLTDDQWTHGCSSAELMKNITTGFPEKGMQAYGSRIRLSDEQLRDVVSYVLSKQGSKPPNPKAVDPAREKRCPDVDDRGDRPERDGGDRDERDPDGRR